MISKEYFYRFFFDQPEIFMRLAVLRILVVGICITMLALGPYDTTYHTLLAPTMFHAHFPFYSFPELGNLFFTLKIAAYCIGILALIGCKTKISLILFTLTFGTLNYYVHCFQEHYCMNQAHLVVALILLCFSPCAFSLSADAFFNTKTPTIKEREIGSFCLMTLGGYIALLFFQTGLSKLLYGGIGWFLSGDTLYVETILDGTDFGRFLTQFTWAFPLMGICVFFFELCFPFVFFLDRYRFFFGSTILLFHFGTYLVMGISFWFLWPLYFPLYLMGTKEFNGLVR